MTTKPPPQPTKESLLRELCLYHTGELYLTPYGYAHLRQLLLQYYSEPALTSIIEGLRRTAAQNRGPDLTRRKRIRHVAGR
ncbi:MAG: hypothetical protein ABSF50_18900 [Burkholderiaceae bacterium]|jgi:hypothetical protein